MKLIPTFFHFHDIIKVLDFEVEVELEGRAVIEETPDGYWIYGVNPGAIADEGQTIEKAGENFRERYQNVLEDISAEAISFEDFREQVESFFLEVDQETLSDWEKTQSDGAHDKRHQIRIELYRRLTETC